MGRFYTPSPYVQYKPFVVKSDAERLVETMKGFKKEREEAEDRELKIRALNQEYELAQLRTRKVQMEVDDLQLDMEADQGASQVYNSTLAMGGTRLEAIRAALKTGVERGGLKWSDKKRKEHFDIAKQYLATADISLSSANEAADILNAYNDDPNTHTTGEQIQRAKLMGEAITIKPGMLLIPNPQTGQWEEVTTEIGKKLMEQEQANKEEDRRVKQEQIAASRASRAASMQSAQALAEDRRFKTELLKQQNAADQAYIKTYSEIMDAGGTHEQADQAGMIAGTREGGPAWRLPYDQAQAKATYQQGQLEARNRAIEARLTVAEIAKDTKLKGFELRREIHEAAMVDKSLTREQKDRIADMVNDTKLKDQDLRRELEEMKEGGRAERHAEDAGTRKYQAETGRIRAVEGLDVQKQKLALDKRRQDINDKHRTADRALQKARNLSVEQMKQKELELKEKALELKGLQAAIPTPAGRGQTNILKIHIRAADNVRKSSEKDLSLVQGVMEQMTLPKESRLAGVLRAIKKESSGNPAIDAVHAVRGLELLRSKLEGYKEILRGNPVAESDIQILDNHITSIKEVAEVLGTPLSETAPSQTPKLRGSTIFDGLRRGETR